MQNYIEPIQDFIKSTGFSQLAENPLCLVMIAIACLLMYLAIVKKYEPMLLLTIAFGMLLTNLPGANMYHTYLYEGGHVNWAQFSQDAGLIDYLYLGVKLGIYPSLIFMGVGAMTDFGPLIANPRSLLLGAAASWASLLPLWAHWPFRIFSPESSLAITKPPPSASSAAQTGLRLSM